MATRRRGGDEGCQSSVRKRRFRGRQIPLWIGDHDSQYPPLTHTETSIRWSWFLVLVFAVRAVVAGEGDFRTVAAWGDSLTAASYPRILAALSGLRVENGGVNGQTSSQIAARMRSATNLHRCPTLLWVGRNNYDPPQTVIRDLESMVEALARAGNTQRFLVLGVINSSYGGYENRDTAPHRSILELNRQLRERYGDRFVPVREVLIDAYNPEEPGDVIDHSNDVPPRSLRSDELHLNEAGYRVLVDYLFRNKMTQLRGDWGWDERVSLQNRDGLWTVKAEVRLGWRYQLESSTGLLQWEDESEPIGPAVRTVEWEKPLYPTAQRFFRLRRLPD